MEYSNLHSQHQLQDQVVNAPTSSLPTLPTTTLLPSTTTANKYSNSSSNIILSCRNSTSTGNDVYTQLISEAIPNSRSAWSPHDHRDFMSYGNDITRSFNQLQYYSPNQQSLPLSNMKEEISDSFSKPSEKVISNPLEVVDRLNRHEYSTNCKQNINIPPCDMVDSIWLNNNYSISSDGCQKSSAGQVPYSINTSTSSTETAFGGFSRGAHELNLRYDLSDTFPISTNYKGVNSDPLCSMSSSSSLAFNFQGLDLLSSSTSYPCSQLSSSHVNLGPYERSGSLGHDDHHDVFQESNDSPPSNSSNITSAFKSEVSRTKRPSSSGNFSEPKASQSAAKKPRPVLRSSNPPLKIRKEKLGDRIAALHRLVAPFGKTDTASVLTEAIGYIQFLRDQVQTLSVPYMMSLYSKPSRKMQQQGLSKEEEKETKRELRSRGLCLVPISCVSYISGYD